MNWRKLLRDSGGAAIVEMAFALPVFILMLWSLVQLGLVFHAISGMQHALGQGARYATLWPQPAIAAVKQKITDEVYGVKPGTFVVDDPVLNAAGYVDLKVTYTQKTDLIFFPGPTISVARTKRVWIAA